MPPRKIVDARADEKGNITQVKIEGNQNFTPLDTAMDMADAGKIKAVTVRPANAKKHLRTLPDSKKSNNLDDFAGDT